MNRLANTLLQALEEMGLTFSVKRSRLSESRYVTVRGDGDEEPVIVRVSGHELPHFYKWQNGDPEMEVRCPGHLYRVVRRLAEHFARQVPPRFSKEAQEQAARRGSLGASARWARELERARAAVVSELERDAAGGFAGRLPLLRDLAEKYNVTVKSARRIVLALKLARAEGRAGRWTSVLEFLRSNADRLHLGNW